MEQGEQLVPPQPADSIATIDRRPYGITIDIPAAGIWKGSRGLILFSIVWNGFISIFITVAVLGLTGAIEVEGDGPLWLLPLFMIPFIAVGIGTLLAAINMGRRTAASGTTVGACNPHLVPASRSATRVRETRIQDPARGFGSAIVGVVVGIVFMSIAAGVVFFVGREELKNGFGGGDLLTLAFFAVWGFIFGGAGTAVFLSSIIGACRRFQITADGHQLIVVRRGLSGRKTFTWDRESLEAVVVTATGTKVNDRAYYQVSIRSRKGSPVGIMAGQDRSDLAFVVAAINETLGLTEAETITA